MPAKRKIAVVTGSRAEYGHLYWIIKSINEDPGLSLLLIVTGMHLSSDFGSTVNQIIKDGFPIAAKVNILSSSDTEGAIAKAMGMGIIKFARIYEKIKPDIIVLLGDRFEILSAAAAAMPFRIPIAHIHGGESTEGLIDELIRHAITKMSHVHFASNRQYRSRIIQMGENPANVFCFGAPGLDNVRKLKLLGRKELEEVLNIPPEKKIGVVTYHPVTLEERTASHQMEELLRSLNSFDGLYWVFTSPNTDTGWTTIAERIRAFTKRFPESSGQFISLGQVKYLSLLKHASVMVGNSSSGLIEAPSFKLPVVNIGDRQKGRIRASNVIDVSVCEEKAITRAIKIALSPDFIRSLRYLRNPYGQGSASTYIVDRLKRIELGEYLIKKRFYDITR
ncbi:MAG: UDP-N-acetylglucosamine 2-epimerase [Candidatus Omnitrophica bacterium]|nr:UDP-N-acetylglucosamine 2-epimerase [Candidatus Omnitrophota bacterium]MCM8790617.1 UDP-N-acetylglucosamine 2-epimerase [Candidatus Omnitrophota bacterium]